MQVSIFKDAFTPHSPVHKHVLDILEDIRKGVTKSQVLAIRNAYTKVIETNFKQKLPSICFSGTFDMRTDDGLLQHSGLICLDFDNITQNAGDTDELQRVKYQICKSPYVFACFISPTGTGLKVLVKIPADAAAHAKHFEGLRVHFCEYWPHIDQKCSNISRLCFQGWDPDIYINTSAEVFSQSEKDVWKTKHSLQDRRYRAQLVIPKNLPTYIAIDKKLMKLLSVYFALKPLYYSGVITKAKSRYREIAEYLNIGESTLRMRLGMLRKAELVRFDKAGNLYLASREKLCQWIKKQEHINEIFNEEPKINHKHCHSIDNYSKYNEDPADMNHEHLLRTLVIEEYRQRQKNVIEDKIFLKEKYSEKCESLLKKGVSPDETWDRYYQRVSQHLLVNKKLRQQKTLMMADKETVDALVRKHQGIYNTQRRDDMSIDPGDFIFPDIDPVSTLSCWGVARIFGLCSPSSGHYWENILLNEGLLAVKNRCLPVKEHSPVMYKRRYSKHCGIYSRKSKKTGAVAHFLTLSNEIEPML